MNEDYLLTVFEKLNIRTGNLDPRVIKAWFDTDCDDLLNWLCASVMEECYVSAQEQTEFEQLESVLTNNQLNIQCKMIEVEFPDIFNTEENLSSIDIANYTLDMLEEQQCDYDQQLQVNKQLYESLLKEYSQVSSEEIQAQLEEESAQEECLNLSNQLDRINQQTFQQIEQYKENLDSYEDAEYPKFANNVDTFEFEEEFLSIITNVQSSTKFDSDLFEISVDKDVSAISELGNRLFDSITSNLALQMEIEGLNCTLKFLENHNVHTVPSNTIDSFITALELNRDQQKWMLKVIEETSLKVVEQFINKLTLKCSQNELDFFMLRLNYLNCVNEYLVKICLYFVIMYNLYYQEKLDIRNSSQFFRNISKYVNKDILDSSSRKEAMLNIISEYTDFSSKPMEHKYTLLGDFGLILLKSKNLSMDEVVKGATSLRNKMYRLQKDCFSDVTSDAKLKHRLLPNIQVLKDFLISGPTTQIVVVPFKLQMLILEADKILAQQASAVKWLIQTVQESKGRFSRKKWIQHRNQLWMHFLTDTTKVASFLDQLKIEAKINQKETV